MRLFAAALTALALLAEAREPEYRVTLSFHPGPFNEREWSIAVYRLEKTAWLDVDNYGNKVLNCRLDNKEYIDLVEFINSRGIWNLKDRYPAQGANPYHRIEVESGKYKNSFKVEAGPPLTGNASRYREIIRRLENLARIKIER